MFTAIWIANWNSWDDDESELEVEAFSFLCGRARWKKVSFFIEVRELRNLQQLFLLGRDIELCFPPATKKTHSFA